MIDLLDIFGLRQMRSRVFQVGQICSKSISGFGFHFHGSVLFLQTYVHCPPRRFLTCSRQMKKA